MKVSKCLGWVKRDISLNKTPEIFFLRSCWERLPIITQDNSAQASSSKAVNASNSDLVSWPYLIYRLVFMGYFVSTKVSNMTCTTNLEFYFLFLTNWTYWMQVIYSVLYAINLIWVKFIKHHFHQPPTENKNELTSSKITIVTIGISKNNDGSSSSSSEVYIGNQHLSILEKIIWINFNIVNVIPYGVTLIYWGVLYTGPSGSTCSIIHNFIVHASNSLLALLDNLIVGIPVHITHMIFPMSYGLVYLIFTVLYEVTNGVYSDSREYIYSIINWKNSPGSATITCILGIFVVAIAHLIFNWGIYKFRLLISKSGSSKQELQLTS